MMFLRTVLGIVFVACLVALAGLGYRLWELQRQLAARVKALELQAASTEADLAEIRACCDATFDGDAAAFEEYPSETLAPQGDAGRWDSEPPDSEGP